jgi:hypothetical protein
VKVMEMECKGECCVSERQCWRKRAAASAIAWLRLVPLRSLRTEGALRQRAIKWGVGLGHQR